MVLPLSHFSVALLSCPPLCSCNLQQNLRGRAYFHSSYEDDDARDVCVRVCVLQNTLKRQKCGATEKKYSLGIMSERVCADGA